MPSDIDTRAFALACVRARQAHICVGSGPGLLPACVGEPYVNQLTATGGTPWVVTATSLLDMPAACAVSVSIGDTFPYAWEIVSGSLPPGLDLDCTTGIISGD